MKSGYRADRISNIEDLDHVVHRAEHPVLLVEGIRKLPKSDIPSVRRIARMLVERYGAALFRSGNARGTDTVFADIIAETAPDRFEYVLPTPDMGRHRRNTQSAFLALSGLSRIARDELGEYTVRASPHSERLVKAQAGRIENSRLAAMGEYLMRDTLKVLGAREQGILPATAGIFYVNESDPLTGGTGHTIRVCLQHGVPVVFQHVWKEW